MLSIPQMHSINGMSSWTLLDNFLYNISIIYLYYFSHIYVYFTVPHVLIWLCFKSEESSISRNIFFWVNCWHYMEKEQLCLGLHQIVSLSFVLTSGKNIIFFCYLYRNSLSEDNFPLGLSNEQTNPWIPEYFCKYMVLHTSAFN